MFEVVNDSSIPPSRALELLPLLLPRACAPVSARVQVAIERSIALALFPGGRLPSERQLATTLDVSRTALRAGLDLVRASGYAEQSLVGRSGGVPTRLANSMTADEIRDIAGQALDEIGELAAVRRYLEPTFARAAALRGDDRLVERLILSQERLASGPSQMVHRLTDGEFHYALAMVCGADPIIGMVLRARADLLRWRDRLPMEDTVGHSVTEHWAIIDAIQEGDGDGAEAAMRAHLESSEILFTLFLRRYLDEPEIVLAEGEAAVQRRGEPALDPMLTKDERWSPQR
jgi:DNA-binding FadR family transcriptional regulator